MTLPRVAEFSSAVPETTKMRAMDAIRMDSVGKNAFESRELWKPAISRGAFGGQMAAQALMAASKTVPPHFSVNSLHSYFLLPGNIEVPILYKVEEIRSGRSFASRSVHAFQSEKKVFTMICSFQVFEKSGVEHQYVMPSVLGPEYYKPELRFEGTRSIFGSSGPSLYELAGNVGVIGRSVTKENLDVDYLSAHPLPEPQANVGESADSPHAFRRWWLKPDYEPSEGENTFVSDQCVLTYFSDFRCLFTTTLPHNLKRGSSTNFGISMMASLDHSIWFHAPFSASEWMLYDLETSRASSGRGYVTGRVFSRDGVLVASVAQEGLLRVTDTGDTVDPVMIKNNPPQI
ncbi:Acyl-coenzyme A thioesterase 8 [Smittium mucronatum]|uniref:Acyl-coenzyme A thioesterase 8 n=1 Tax=Smittium mucronatum TaxID=133383 RepID=A0A1R0GXT8_9FUNG|nr:Acyl-coenzyme A thioesterase 8 [Smittium mucronatum]